MIKMSIFPMLVVLAMPSLCQNCYAKESETATYVEPCQIMTNALIEAKREYWECVGVESGKPDRERNFHSCDDEMDLLKTLHGWIADHC